MAQFWPISSVFGAKEVFLKRPVLSHTTSFEFLATCQNLEKTNDPIPRKHPDRGKDGQTPFCRTIQATVAGPVNIVNEILAE